VTFFWRNPELVRHARAKLRLPRAFGVLLAVSIAHALLAVAVWSHIGQDPRFFRVLYTAILAMQSLVFLAWCASACGRAIPAEREARTYDYLRLTRLTPRELALGKLLGEPIVAYVALACSIPFGLTAGILAGYHPLATGTTYLLILATGLFVCVLALVASIFLGRGGGLAAAIAVVLQLESYSAVVNLHAGPSLAVFSILPAILELHGLGPAVRPTMFGFALPWFVMNAFVLILFGCLLELALERNLKRDPESLVFFSRAETLLTVAIINVLYYALIDPAEVGTATGVTPIRISGAAVRLNAILIFLAVFAMIVPRETLRVWSRRYVASQERYFSETGPPWPWIILVAGLAYSFYVIAAFFLRRRAPFGEWPLAATAIELLVLLAFASRDLLFIQWSRLTRMRSPVTGAVFVLCLSYFSLALIAVNTAPRDAAVSSLVVSLTPAAALAAARSGAPPAKEVWLGGALQIVIATLLLRSIANRLRRPVAP
jgi:hypothetical protein